MIQIPLIDLRDASLTALLDSYSDGAKQLVISSRTVFGWAGQIASHAALPLGDSMARRWLAKSANPYYGEIAEFDRRLNTHGIFALNIAYEWGCTSGAFAQNNSITLARVLDWPFPGLGRHMVVVRQKGSGGEFYNITWPAVSPMFQGLAPGRFAASLNQAPMRRHKHGIYRDWLKNRRIFFRQRSLPPGHLLRQVFETASSYDEAKTLLTTTPVALPVIFTLTGIKPGEGCVIERLENAYAIRELGNNHNVVAANHFETRLNGDGYGWMPRAIVSHERSDTACALNPGTDFEWFRWPVANELSRLAFTADAAKGTLSLIATEGETILSESFVL